MLRAHDGKLQLGYAVLRGPSRSAGSLPASYEPRFTRTSRPRSFSRRRKSRSRRFVSAVPLNQL